MITCSDIMNCKDYYYCIFCPAQAWLWKRIGRGEKPKTVDNEPLYKCDPNKNIKCPNTKNIEWRR